MTQSGTISGTIRRAYVDVYGLQLHYRTAGEPGCPVLLLLHQSPSNSAMYEALMGELASRYRIFAPDTPGFGNSDSLPELDRAVEVADYARYIQGFCQALGLQTMFVFGHHTGAAIAVQLEHDYPGSAHAMVLSGPTLLSDEQKESLPQLASEFPLDKDGSHLQSMWVRLRDKDPAASLELTQRELLSAFSCGASYQASYLAVTRQDFAAQLKLLQCPVLVFAGDTDPLYPAVDPTLALLSAGSKAELAGGERTYVCDRQATLIASKLDQFFTGLGS